MCVLYNGQVEYLGSHEFSWVQMDAMKKFNGSDSAPDAKSKSRMRRAKFSEALHEAEDLYKEGHGVRRVMNDRSATSDTFAPLLSAVTHLQSNCDSVTKGWVANDSLLANSVMDDVPEPEELLNDIGDVVLAKVLTNIARSQPTPQPKATPTAAAGELLGLLSQLTCPFQLHAFRDSISVETCHPRISVCVCVCAMQLPRLL